MRKNKRKTEAIDFEEDDNMMDFLSRDTPLDAAPPRKSSFKPLVNFSFDSDGDEDVPPVVPPPVIAPHPPSPVQAAIVIDKYEDDVKPALPEEEEDDDDPEPDTESEEEDAIIIDGPKSISTEQPLVDFVAVSMARGAVAAVREMGTTVGKLLESSRQDLAVQCLRVARESVKGVSLLPRRQRVGTDAGEVVETIRDRLQCPPRLHLSVEQGRDTRASQDGGSGSAGRSWSGHVGGGECVLREFVGGGGFVCTIS